MSITDSIQFDARGFIVPVAVELFSIDELVALGAAINEARVRRYGCHIGNQGSVAMRTEFRRCVGEARHRIYEAAVAACEGSFLQKREAGCKALNESNIEWY